MKTKEKKQKEPKKPGKEKTPESERPSEEKSEASPNAGYKPFVPGETDEEAARDVHKG